MGRNGRRTARRRQPPTAIILVAEAVARHPAACEITYYTCSEKSRQAGARSHLRGMQDIDPKEREKGIQPVKDYRPYEQAAGDQSERIIAVGTSALRDASNKKEFCDFILQTVGISIEILSGNEEAEWTYRGAVVGINTSTESFTVLDIGGGSTEIISGTGLTNPLIK